jgi:hypothetical protein
MTKRNRRSGVVLVPVLPELPKEKFNGEKALRRKIARERETIENDFANFKKKFEVDPVNALEWSDRTFQSAAKLKVTLILEDFFARLMSKGDEYVAASVEDAVGEMITWLKNEVMREAKYSSRSSSNQTNIMAGEILAAKAQWLEYLEDLLKAMIEEM